MVSEGRIRGVSGASSSNQAGIKGRRISMGEEEHRQYHIDSHETLDVLMADFIIHTGKLLSEATVIELLEWSYQQTIKPAVF